jgi:hypothetical protein
MDSTRSVHILVYDRYISPFYFASIPCNSHTGYGMPKIKEYTEGLFYQKLESMSDVLLNGEIIADIRA